MKKKIKLNNKTIRYIFKRNKRSKRLRLAIYPGGSLIATAPIRFSFKEVENFILEKAEWILEKLSIMKEKKKGKLLSRRSKKEYLMFRDSALEIVNQKLEELNSFYHFRYKKVAIRNQKTLWGSCGEDGSLSFNYKIIFLPEKCLNYIIVHEICHLRELNHSAKFWRLVEKTIPDYKKIEEKLKNF